MKFQLLLLAVALFAVLALVQSRPLNRVYCFGDNECDSTNQEYCHRPLGNCFGEGYCATRLAAANCPSTTHAVCGCDGETFENDCFAAVAGVSMAHRGACAN